jgi:hypothetical protein
MAGLGEGGAAEATEGATSKTPVPMSNAEAAAPNQTRAYVNICSVCGNELDLYKVHDQEFGSVREPLGDEVVSRAGRSRRKALIRWVA